MENSLCILYAEVREDKKIITTDEWLVNFTLGCLKILKKVFFNFIPGSAPYYLAGAPTIIRKKMQLRIQNRIQMETIECLNDQNWREWKT